jgi:two-component system chemotaxis sensor kinase CheA
MVDSLSKTFAIPISSIVEIVVVNKGDVKEIEHQETILHRDRVLPIVRLDSLFGGGVAAATDKTQLNIVIAEFGAKQFGIVVDRLQRQQDIVVKQLTKELKGIRGFAGATILGDGNVALVLDVATLV